MRTQGPVSGTGSQCGQSPSHEPLPAPSYLGRWPPARRPGRSRHWERCRCHSHSQRSRGLRGETQVSGEAGTPNLPLRPVPGNARPAGEGVWGPGTGTYEGCSAHCPQRAPSRGSSHSRTLRGRRGGPAGVCKRGENTFHLGWVCQGGGASQPSQCVSQQTVLETLRRGSRKFLKKNDLTASPGGRTETKAPVSYRLLLQEHRVGWPGEGALRGVSALRRKSCSGRRAQARLPQGLCTCSALSGRSILGHTGSFPPSTRVSCSRHLLRGPSRPP